MRTPSSGMHFAVSAEPVVDGLRLHLAGVLDLAAVPLLLVHLQRVPEQRVVLDLRELDGLCPTAVRALCDFASRPGRTVGFAGASESHASHIALAQGRRTVSA